MYYLDKKGIKFEDERLNCAINLISKSKEGKKRLDFLLDNLTDESINVINSKQDVSNVPIKNGFFLECLQDDDFDPSYNNTTYFISIIKDGYSYDYCFYLSYFHDRSDFEGRLGIYNESNVLYDRWGNYLKNEPVSGKNLDFYIVPRNKDKLFSFEGIEIVYDYGKTIKRKHLDVENILVDIRKSLKDRQYYRMLDKEIYKLYYPSEYNYYNSKEQLEIADYHEKVKLANDSAFECNHFINNDKDMSPLARYNMLCREIEDVNIEYLENNCISYEYWCDFHGANESSNIDYKDWIKKGNVNKLVINMESVPVLKENIEEKKQTIFECYNPNKMRYDEDEEEEINRAKRKC